MNTYEIVTERVINLLERGVIPWRQPWAAPDLFRNSDRAAAPIKEVVQRHRPPRTGIPRHAARLLPRRHSE